MTGRHHDNDNGPLGRIYTLAEAAEYLRMSSKIVAKTARKHGLAVVANGEFLFSDSDLLAIWDAMRCHSNSVVAKEATTGTSAALSGDKAFSSLRAQVTKKPRRRSA
jgi:hypothetical protein